MPYIGRVRGLDFSALADKPVELAAGFPVDEPIGLPLPPQFRFPTEERFTFASPAAGANSFNLRPIPGDAWEMLVWLKLTLTTDANVANRLVEVRYLDQVSGGTQYYSAIAPINLAASLQGVYQAGIDQIPLTAVAQNNIPIRLPQIALPPGWLIRVQIQSVQAADQVSAISFLMRRWKSGRAPRPEPPWIA